MPNIIFSEASGVADSAFGKSQAPIRSIIEEQAQLWEKNMIYRDVFKLEKSEHWAESYTNFTDVGDYEPVTENGAPPQTGIREGYKKTIENVEWKNRFIVSRAMMDDANVAAIKKGASKISRSYERTREKLCARMLAGAVSGESITVGGQTFSTKGADGKALFATDHPNIFGGSTQTNKFAGDFSAANLGKLEEKMQKFVDEDGEYLDLCPNTIIIPNNAALKQAVFAACGSDRNPETANNDFNWQVGRWNIIVWQYLNLVWGDNNYWILADLDWNNFNGCAILQDRKGQEIESWIDHDTKANVWDGYWRGGVGFNDWRGFAVCGVSGASEL